MDRFFETCTHMITHPESTPMKHLLAFLATAMLLAVLSPGARAQGVVYYPPADGQFYAPPPLIPAPGGFGEQYLQSYPANALAPGYYVTTPNIVPQQPQGVPATNRVLPRIRGRVARGARAYSRGYSQPPAPYATPLPQGQLYYPGSIMAPNYTPFSRYGSYGGGYGYSPYGSGYYTGYWKGWSLGY
jgi:hypothetical protein